MFKITRKEIIAENTYLLEIHAPDIAKHAKQGQFLVIIPSSHGERIPLTIADHDDENVSIVFVVAGKSTSDLAKLNAGDVLQDVAGPLGHPSEVYKENFICLIGGGVGIAAIYPIAKEYAQLGKKVHCILGVRNKAFLFWEDKFKKFCDKVIVSSDDGSIGFKGNVVQCLENELKTNKYEVVVAVGPTIMMKFVSLFTKKQNLKTIVSLNTLMVDGVGMCGCCRIRYDGKIKFVCVDGPEFDAHKVDFEEVMNRNATYKEEEQHTCNLNKIILQKK